MVAKDLYVVDCKVDAMVLAVVANTFTGGCYGFQADC